MTGPAAPALSSTPSGSPVVGAIAWVVDAGVAIKWYVPALRERIAAALETVTIAEIAAENVASPVPVSKAAVLHQARS